MASCNRCGKYYKVDKVLTDGMCATCACRVRTQQMLKAVHIKVEPKVKKPKAVIITDDEQSRIDHSIRIRHGLPADKGRVIPRDSEEFNRLAAEIIAQESKRGRKYDPRECQISKLAR